MRNALACLLLLIGGVHAGWSDPWIDLEEELGQPFVVHNQKIDIPGYPTAFNASIVRWKERLLLSFRIIPSRSFSFVSWIGLIWLDDNFHPVGLPQVLQTRDRFSFVPSRAEDARLVTIGDRLYMVYSDNPYPMICRGGFRVYVSELLHDGKAFTVSGTECLSVFEGENKDKREKNWVPFDFNGQMYLAYSLQPHRILQPFHGRGECQTVSCSQSAIEWDWGVLRGGTPALPSRGEYLAFFHSSKDMASAHSDGKTIAHYFMGAYTFEAYPPFAITGISLQPIIGKDFYHGPAYRPYWKPVRVVFPCGFVQDDDHVWVAYGKQDYEIWIAKMEKKGLYESLAPTSLVKDN